MTRRLIRSTGLSLKSAAIFVALFLCAPAWAQDVTLTSRAGALELTGRIIGYDGTYAQIESAYGPLTLKYDQVTCAGQACPDPATYVPEIRFSGAAAMTDLLMPALIDGFARSQSFDVETLVLDTEHTTFVLRDEGSELGRFAFRATTSAEGFADLIAHEADIVMSLREVSDDEAARAAEIGIGRLDSARQGRIVALDALVPVASPFQRVDQISLSQLADAFAGKITSWAEIGGDDQDLTLHLPPVDDGMTQRFLNMVLNGRAPGSVTYHDSRAAMLNAIVEERGALGITSFTDTGIAKPLTLRDRCGFVAVPRLSALKTEDYPLTAPLFLYLPERRLPQIARDFLRFLRLPEAQLIVRRANFVDQGAIPITMDAQGQRFANAIAAAGPEIDLGELQRMVRVLLPRTRLSTSFRFEVGSTRLDAQSRSNLLALGQAIRDGAYDGRTLLLVGFSDGRGAAVANRELSSARAEAVLRDLDDLLGGIPVTVQVETEAFGEALPMGCDNTEWGRQTNRRVELWLSE